jgi:anti-anti-sigma regulatory factor
MENNKSIIKIEEKKDKGYTLIVAGNKLDTETVIDFKDKTRNIKGNIILDLYNLERLTSAGLGSLLMLMENRTVCIVGLNIDIKKIIEIAGLTRKFLLFDSIRDAERELERRTSTDK